MPLTFAHPAAVLPFSKPARRYLSLTGLVIGSMVPDFEYFIRMKLLSRYSHTWQGLFWFDVPLGIMLVIIYEFWVKDSLIIHLPTTLNRKFFSFKGYRNYYSATYLAAIFISVLLGAATHLAWDGFTHPAGYFVHKIPKLSHIMHFHGYHMRLYAILQQASTFVGLLFILIICLSLPKGQLTKVKNISGYWLQVALVMLVTIAIKLAAGMQLHEYATVLITIIDGAMFGLVTASALAG